MPQLLVEDTAPFLTYSEGHWRPGVASLHEFTGNSFAVTNVSGATVSFTFYGTAVEIFGSRRPGNDYGRYRVTLDDETFEEDNTTVATPDFRASLFSRKGLRKAEHTVVLENRQNKFRDLDYITWDQTIGEDDEPYTVHTIQDSDPMFTYEPASQWTTDPPFVNGYSGGSGHATNLNGAKAKLRFEGDAVALYGPAGAEAAEIYSVQVDNRNPQSFSATQFRGPRLRPKQLMYFGSNLGRGEHELVISLVSVSSSQQLLAVDYAEVFTTPSTGGSAGSSSSLGLIVAIAATGALAALSLAFMTWVFVLVKKGKLRRISEFEQAHPNPSIVATLFRLNRSQDLASGPAIPVFLSPQSTGGNRRLSIPITGTPTGVSDAYTSVASSTGHLTAQAPPLTRKARGGGQAVSSGPGESPVPPPLYSASVNA